MYEELSFIELIIIKIIIYVNVIKIKLYFKLASAYNFTALELRYNKQRYNVHIN